MMRTLLAIIIRLLTIVIRAHNRWWRGKGGEVR